nr:thioredoxin family protein [uncultured Desulfobulbus sp.]
MVIIICGPGCASCDKTEKIVFDAAAAKGVAAAIEKVKDFKEMAQMGVFSTPAVVIDGEVKCVGRIPKQEEVEQWLG